MGFLPEALRNYLLRLGWGHGDDEIITTEQAIQWFDLDGIGRSPSRFDLAKLLNLNGHYIRQTADARLAALIAPRLATIVGRPLTAAQQAIALEAMPSLKERAKTLADLADSAAFYIRQRPLALDDKAAKLINDDGRETLIAFAQSLAVLQNWRQDVLEEEARRFVEERGIKLGQLAQPLRAALTGSVISPPIFEVMRILGRDESLARIKDTI